MTKLLQWNIYEIKSSGTPINGVMFRGRIRKLGLEKGFNVLVENTQDMENGVRFAVIESEDASIVEKYVHSILKDAKVTLVTENVPNPVLSKLKVNRQSRYEL